MAHSRPTPCVFALSLQSGSNGNCVYVEAAGVRLLFDAGIAARHARDRLATFGRDIRDCHAVVISHDHGDHVRSAGVYQRMFGLPLYMTPATYDCRASRLGRLSEVHTFGAGETLCFGAVRVETIPTPHDGRDSVVFVVEHAARRVGLLTDLGHVFPDLTVAVTSLDALFIESNYDQRMLEVGPYPHFLKERIRGVGGHISNTESARLLAEHAGPRLQWACLAHLSHSNNTPDLALRAHRRAWAEGFPLSVAGRFGACGPFRL